MVKAARDILFVMFLGVFWYFQPAFETVFNYGNTLEFNILILTNPVLYTILFVPLLVLGIFLFIIHKFDNWEESRENKRLIKLFKQAAEEAKNERVKYHSEHFDSVL